MKNSEDWKDIAATYYEKAFSLAVLLTLFTFMVSPKIDVKAYERTDMKITESVEDIPEVKDIIKPPTETKQMQINILIDDDSDSDLDEDIEILETIESTTLDVSKEIDAPSTAELPSKFASYEEIPVIIYIENPVYPEFEKRAGIEGSVFVEVVVMGDGTVGKVELKKSSNSEAMDKAAMDAVKKYRFQPAKSNGKPVACWISFPIKFSLGK